MKENFPNLAKEIDFQESLGSSKSHKELESRKHTPRHIIIALSNIKEKKTQLPTKEFP